MDKKILVKELATKVRKYQAKAKGINLDLKEIGEMVFVQYKTETLFNPKYISVVEFYTLKALEAFLKSRPELSTEEVLTVIKSNNKEFDLLQKFNDKVPTMVDDIKANGVKVFAINYINNLIFANKKDDLEDEDVLGV